jgi:branched-chain amino acid transport system substrate-binding protein
VLWANDDMGKGGHDMVTKEAKARGITITADLSAENNQVDFSSDVLKVKQSNADAIFMLIHEEETARFLKEAQKQGIGIPAIGDSMMLNPKVLDLAGDAGVGARGFVGLTGDAPVKAMQDMADRFKARFGYAPDHNGIQGYIVMYVIKTITNRIGKVDHAAFATALHGATITVEQEPGVLLTTTWNGDGDLDRDTFLAQVEPGNRQKIIAVLARSPTP